MRKSRAFLLLLVVLVCFSMGCKSEPSSATPDNPKPQVTNYTITFNANGGSGEMPVQIFAKDE
ncbi:MAG: hypothetical protein MJ052_04205, partial [Sphaerochaetaceae bacterium]|nr:hypothetical protein [Sphaerochaetaceae bacterium]